MLKHAGWDAIVIEGKASSPVWVDIRNRKVEFRDASDLWGKDTWTTQLEIWDKIGVPRGVEETAGGTSTRPPRRPSTRDRPGPHHAEAGRPDDRTRRREPDERRLPHPRRRQRRRQGGFGAVWGSKNLKAISVIGTGEIPVADPTALLKARVVMKQKYVTDIDAARLLGLDQDRRPAEAAHS
jgi:aldehyde:ferredoxin oxidoreductase